MKKRARGKVGHPRLEDTNPKLAQRIRAAIEQGASNDTIKRDFKVGSSVPERLRLQLAAEQRAKALLILVPLIEAAIRGGLTRLQVANILFQATGLEIPMRGGA